MSEPNVLVFKDLAVPREDLTSVPVESVLEWVVSPGHLLYATKKGKHFLLLRAGDLIEQKKLLGYQQKGLAELFLAPVANRGRIEKIKEFFLAFKGNELIPSEKERARQDYTRFFSDLFWHGETRGSQLDWIIAGMEVWMRLSDEELQGFYSLNVNLSVRSFWVASLACSLALMVGPGDGQFLQDLYHAALFCDYALLRPSAQYVDCQALTQELQAPGKGQAFLENWGHSSYFQNHPHKSFDLARQEFSHLFHNSLMINLIKFHHEYGVPEAFPQKLYAHALDTSELCLLFADQLSAFPLAPFTPVDGQGLLKKRWQELEGHQALQKVGTRRMRQHLLALFSSSDPYARAPAQGAQEQVS